MEKWLYFYHPSTAVFVDDSQAFLSAIKHRLPTGMKANFFNDSKKALEQINQMHTMYDDSHITCEIKKHFDLESHHHDDFLSFKLKHLTHIKDNPSRFSRISVVIVDRMMPDLDGLNFCRQLKNYPIKKIMLTGSNDFVTATNAFNEGIIDFFLLKNTPDLSKQLVLAIQRMQYEYFCSLSEQMMGYSLEKMMPFINNQNMLHFLQNKMKQLNAVEYYLLDQSGSILFIDNDGVLTTLAIASDQTIQYYATIAFEHEEQAIADQLYSKEKLLFFPQESDSLLPVNQWQRFLFDATPIPDYANLFYALIN